MKGIRVGDTAILPPGSYSEDHVRVTGHLIASRRTHFWGWLLVTGDLELGPWSSVAGQVSCGNAIIGNDALVRGHLRAAGSVIACDRARIGAIRAGGDVMLRPGVQVGDVRADGEILVLGKVAAGRLLGRKVTVAGG